MSDVQLRVWRLPPRDVPAALTVGRRAVRTLGRDEKVRFAKLLGTATDAFTPRAATPTRWALLTCGAPVATSLRWWDRHCVERATLSLRALSARGSWDRVAPFTATTQPWEGPILALTRATLRARTARQFYRAVPPVAAALAAAPGCRVAFGIGESPLLRQGTVSIWDDAATMRTFAYAAPAHVQVVAETPRRQWYAEELFARFALVDADGTIAGRAVA